MFKSQSFVEPAASNLTRSAGRSANPNFPAKSSEVEPRRHDSAGAAANAPVRLAHILPVEIGFLVHYGVQQGVLMAAAARAKSLGLSAVDVLLADGSVSEAHFYSSLARHLRLAYIDGPIQLGPQTSFPETIHSGLAAIDSPDGPACLVAPRGALIADLIARSGRREVAPTAAPGRPRRRMDLSRLAITTPTHLSRLVQAQEREKIAHRASADLPAFDRALSAKSGPGVAQILCAFFGLAAALLCPFAMPHVAALIVSTILCCVFFAVIVTRLFATAAALGAAPLPRAAISDDQLPVYSIVVALCREERMAAQLIKALDKIDYPRAKLEIKIVVEDDDPDTLMALAANCRSSSYELIVAPTGLPRTKPRALNVALPLLRGEFTVVFDAEDIPDPAQIRMAAERFAAAPEKLACLQARLAISASESNWLQRLFALEYAALFDVLNVGLAELDWPFPLGGSSNHFRTSVLRELHGWDAWNVTEDADLGFRLARFGYRIETLNSATLEEAPLQLGAWFRQRRRWFKGWYQTAITLTRAPRRLAKELGWIGVAKVAALLSSAVLAPLAWPLSAGLFAYELVCQGWPRPESLPGMVHAALWIFVAFAGLPALVWPILVGMKRRGLTDLWPSLPLLLPYYLLITAAAWIALYDLARRPHHWFKTEHGLSRRAGRRTKAPA